MNTPLLDKIESPADLRTLPEETLPQVCNELRARIIERLSVNPGHFASSMGAVEITVALHYVFSTPDDRIIWDVGHQAYAHKLLTGRKKEFATLRTKGGISGFPNPKESEYDSFIAGHAGNSVSAALGMAIADLQTPGREHCKTVAVIGDASIGNGLAFEGLNNASNNKNNLLIILSDNDMSIDDNVGALHRYLSEINTSPGYNKFRNKLYQALRDKGIVTDSGRGRLLRFNNSIKALVSGNQNIFEGLNIRYFGPFDGHDISKIIRVLREIKDMEGPRILHLKTIKGKGFTAAEKNPAAWHAPGLFDPLTGEKKKKTSEEPQIPNWQDIFGKTLVELADADPSIVGITAAMLSGTSMSEMMSRYPKRTFDVGISEGHAVTFAGGLAASGKRPFVAIYSSFLQRAYDNIIHDVAIQGLPVTFCIDRAGLVGEDGVTHHGLFDIAYLRLIPSLELVSPMDEESLRNLMFTAAHNNGPLAIRYPRGKAFTPEWKTPMAILEKGKSRIIRDNTGKANVAVISAGPIGQDVEKALEYLSSEGIYATHCDAIWIKPLDTRTIRNLATTHNIIVTVEDGTITGGFGSAVLEYLNDSGIYVHVERLGVADRWVDHGSVEQLKHSCKYDVQGIAETVRRLSNGNRQ